MARLSPGVGWPHRPRPASHHARTTPWVPAPCEDLVQSIAADTAQRDSEATFHEIARLVGENRRIHDLHGINPNPASNVMNPRAEAMMAAGLARLAWTTGR